MQRFNLTFKGEILPGTDPVLARAHFSRLFQIQDPARLERFFSGDSIILRRNLEQKPAAVWYAKMRGLGLQAGLQSAGDASTSPAATSAPPSASASATLTLQAAAKNTQKPIPTSTARWGPNPYDLKPYRSPAPSAERALLARDRAHRALAVALLALCLLGGLAGLDRLLPQPAAVPPLVTAAAATNGDLMLATTTLLLLHDRSGAQADTLTITELGLTDDVMQLLWLSADEWLIQVAPDPAASGNLYRCRVEERQCRAFTGTEGHWHADAAVRIPNSTDIILADSSSGLLLRVDVAGNTVTKQTVTLPAAPVLRIDDGLLFINSAAGPALGVFRYETSAFAMQLDELLLLPEAALAAELTRVRDFARVGAFWWVIMENPDSALRAVFRFDGQWSALPPVLPPSPNGAIALAAWGDRILLLEPNTHSLLRYAAEGVAGTRFESQELNALEQQRSRSSHLRANIMASSRHLCIVAALLALCFGLWQYTRQRVLVADRGRHAPLLGKKFSQVHWLKAAQGKQRSSVAVLRGHIGLLGQQVVLVDHRGVYHIGNGIQIQRHPHTLKIEGVLVYIGSKAKPVFDPAKWPKVELLLSGAGPADSLSILVTLVETHDVLARVAAALTVFITAAVVLEFFTWR